jgi:GNAT superfamily N-acetyltransferase
LSTIRIRQTRREDIPALIALQTRIYPTIPPWNKLDLITQLEMFPQGQIVAEDDSGLLGCASSIMVMWDDWAEEHNWYEITSAGTFDNHNPDGRTLYGVEVFVDPESQGQGVGHLLYEGRRQLCRAMNLKRIIVCGRLPGYQPHKNAMTAEYYARKVIWGDVNDPVLSFQLHEGFSYCGVMPEYIPEDVESCGYASLLVWLNPDYDANTPTVIRDDIDFQLGA